MVKPKMLNYANPDESCFRTVVAPVNNGEDAVSYSRNNQLLETELAKHFPRIELAKALLQQTHQKRRELIEASLDLASNIMNDHAFLK